VREGAAQDGRQHAEIPAGVRAPEAQIAELVANEQALAEQVARLTTERDQYRDLYRRMMEINKKLEQGLLGQKAERLPAEEAQLTLQLLGTLLGALDREAPPKRPEAKQDVAPHQRRKPTGRKPLPENLPRVRVEVLPDEVQREGLEAFERIGEEVSEVVERRPASLVAVQLVRGKFRRKNGRERATADATTTTTTTPLAADTDRAVPAAGPIVVAEPVERPIERGLAGPGMLADTLVRRWQDHMPLHRLEKLYAREGLELARSTLCDWHTELARSTQPLLEAMWQDALQAPYLCTDATGVLVQAKERCRRCHFWVVVAPERHVLYRFSEKHDSQAVDHMLGDYRGYLVADAHAVYDHLFKTGERIEVGCWAHCRRYFFKSLSTDPERAREALAYIRGLFDLERALAEAPRKKRQAERQKQAQPLLEAFFRWCELQREQVLDETPIAKGLSYALNQKQALLRFLEDGRLPVHNNGSELALRRQAVGRKNWLFLGSDQGALANTTFVSLIASCQLHGIEPWAYLRDLFCLLPGWPRRRVLELAPLYWNETLEQEQTQQRLAANPFRQITLGTLG
jgi:transposase